jgi:hypothetical protein
MKNKNCVKVVVYMCLLATQVRLGYAPRERTGYKPPQPRPGPLPPRPAPPHPGPRLFPPECR